MTTQETVGGTGPTIDNPVFVAFKRNVGPAETWDEAELRWAKNRVERNNKPGLQLVINKPSRKDTRKKQNKRVMDRYSRGFV